jgi:EmrB/QacA subfamily drug resistance transporter
MLDAAPVTARTAARPGAVLAVLASAAFLASLDVFVVNVALADIGRSIGGTGRSLADVSWVLNAYAILYAALLVPAGRLADRFSRKRGFLLGLAVFTLASLGCALSGGLWVLVGFRCLQATGAALLTPASLGLLLTATPADRRVRAVRIWAVSGSFAAAAGPVVGGLLIGASWRWIFLINVPLGLVALVAAARLVPDSAPVEDRRLPDLAGGGLLAVAVGALALGLVKAPEWGWGSGRTTGSFVLAALALAAFLLRCSRHPVPVLDLSLLRSRSFAWANVTSVLFAVVFAGQLLALVLFLQLGWHWSPLRTGLAVSPGPLMVPVFAAVGHRLRAVVPVGVLTAVGTALLGASSLLLLSQVDSAPAYASHVLPAWLLGGVGVGLAMPTILSTATSDLPPLQAATGSAVVNMSRQIGSVLGVSVLVAVLGTPTTAAGVLVAFQHGWLVLACVAVLASAAALGTTPRTAAAT